MEKALKVIQNQDSALIDLRARYEDLKDETEKIRRENAAGFYRLKHLLGEKGNSLLDQIYFKDYPGEFLILYTVVNKQFQCDTA